MSTSTESPCGRGRSMIPLVLVIILGAPVTSIGQTESNRLFRQPEPEFEVVPVPEIRFNASNFAASTDDLREIHALIEKLAEVEAPSTKLPAWMYGGEFPRGPRPRTVAFEPIDQSPDQLDVAGRLVAFGPKAIPLLVESLDDTTPSRIEILAAVGPKGEPVFWPEGEGEQPMHAITRGDLCYAIPDRS